MPTTFSERSALPGPPDAVVALLTDPAFLATRAQRSGAVEHDEQVSTAGETTVVRTSRTVSTQGLPGVVADRLGEHVVIEQVERLEPGDDGSWRGTLELTVRGAPVRLQARTAVRPAGRGSEHEVTGTLAVDVPLFGGSVERAALPRLLELVREEVRLAREHLAPAEGQEPGSGSHGQQQR